MSVAFVVSWRARHRRLQLRVRGRVERGQEPSELRASLDEIRGAAHGIIGGMEQRMAENRETEGLERVRALEHEAGRSLGACPSAAIARKASAWRRPRARASPTGPIGERRGAASR